MTSRWRVAPGAAVCLCTARGGNGDAVGNATTRFLDAVGQEDGEAAQVHTTHDVLFLVELPDGWRITAAGCTPQPDEVYRCVLEGS